MPDFQTLTYIQKVDYILTNILFAITIIGLVDNTIIIGLSFRHSLRKYSYSIYNQAKAVLDMIVLTNYVIKWTRGVADFNLLNFNVIFCSISFQFSYLSIVASLCLIAVISLDRLMVVAYPTRFTFVRKKWFQVLVILAVLVYSFLNVILLFINPIHQDTRVGNSTVRVCRSPADTPKVTWIIVANILWFLLVVNNFLTIKLIRFVLASRARVTAQVIEQNKKITKRQYKDRRFAISSIAISITNFVSKLAVGVSLIVLGSGITNFDTTQMLLDFNALLLAIESSSSFFINMALNSVFYDEFVTVFLTERLRRFVSSTANLLSSTNS